MAESDHKTILLVDDEIPVAAGIKSVLEEKGYNVLMVHSGEDAVETVKKIPGIDLILMDTVPGCGMDGVTSAAMILHNRDIPLLFLIGNNEPDIIEKTEKIESYGFVSKQAGNGLLLASIKTAFRLHNSFQQVQFLHEELEGLYEEMQASMEELETTNQELVETQKDLIESEERFSKAFRSSPAPLVITEIDTGRFIDVNDAWVNMIGYTRGEQIDHTSIEIGLWVDNRDRDRLIPELISRGFFREEPIRFKTKTGEQVDALWSAEIIALGSRKVMLSLFYDITERLRAEEALRESEERFSTAFKSSPAPLVISDIETGRVIDVNDSWVKMLGFTREEQVGRLSSEVGIWFNPEDRERIAGKLGNRGFFKNEPISLKTKTGKQVNALWSGEIITVGSKKAMLSLLYDMTERLRAEDALRESEERFSKAFNSNPGPLTITQTNSGRFIDVNDSWVKMLGYTRGELIGKSTVELEIWIYPDERKRLVRKFRRQGFLKEELIDLKTKTGSHVKVLWSAETITLADRKVILSLMYDITKRVQAETELQASEAFLDSIIDQSPFPVLIFNPEGKIVRWNAAAREQAQARDENVLLEKYNLLHDEQLHEQGFMPLIDGVFSRGETVRFINSYDTGNPLPEGGNPPSWVELDSTFFPIKDASGYVTHAVAYLLDITGTVSIRKELADTRAMLESAFEQTPVPMILVSMPDNIIRIANPALYEFLGLDKELNHIGESLFSFRMSWQDIDTDGHPVPFGELPLAQALKGRVTRSREYGVIRSDGSTAWELVSAAPVYNSDGNLIAAFAAFPDITDRKLTEEKLRRSEASLRSLNVQLNEAQRVAKIGSFIFYPGEYMPEWSDELFRISGFDPANGIPDYPEFLLRIHQDDRGKIDSFIEGIRQGRESMSEECRIIHPDGEELVLSQYYETIRSDDTQPPYVLGTVFDITERVKTEAEKELLQKQLVQAQKMESIGRLAGGVAHDFNNMLGVIIGHADLLIHQPDLPEAFNDSLKEIRMAAERSADLTRQLLAFARRQTVSPKLLNLNDTVEGMLKMLRRLIGENIDLVWYPGKDAGSVMMDPSQLDQILANLSVNARDAIGDKGRITIETGTVVFDESYCSLHPGSVPGEYILLAVSDNGSGMEPGILSHLFEPFFTTKETGKGTGLGLATVYGIVKQNNGFINVYSEKGLGSTFRIYLPRYSNKTGSRENDDPDKPVRGNETILLVEDEKMILEITATMLEQLGYTVLAASAPDDAIRISGGYPGKIHLLLTDIVMPGMNGRELAENLLSAHPETRCLFMSGYTDEVIAHHGVLEEGVYFIQKPFTLKDFAAKVREVLSGM